MTLREASWRTRERKSKSMTECRRAARSWNSAGRSRCWAMASLTSSKASSCRRECSSGEVNATSGGEMTGSAIECRITSASAKAQLKACAREGWDSASGSTMSWHSGEAMTNAVGEKNQRGRCPSLDEEAPSSKVVLAWYGQVCRSLAPDAAPTKAFWFIQLSRRVAPALRGRYVDHGVYHGHRRTERQRSAIQRRYYGVASGGERDS